MDDEKHNILIVDDEESILESYRLLLKPLYNLVLMKNPKEAIELLRKHRFSLIVLDVRMPQMNGIETLEKIREIDKHVNVIMVTAVHDVKTAVQVLKLGAHDYITKPFDVTHFMSVVEKALRKKAAANRNIFLSNVLKEKEFDVDLVGESDEMKKVFDLIDKAASINSTVLITGESGTGKELVAHAIFRKSSRFGKPFVVVNCAAVPESLVESELFGHERGSFTGALERKTGKFEAADKGTLFLDEIGCMKPPLQAKLLRVLQNNIIEKVGSHKHVEVDVRIIAATNISLEASVEKGEFRQDLYYRLNVVRIHLPTLNKRRSDIPLLINYFLKRYNALFNKKISGFEEKAINFLKEYNWPGNVRELQNLVERTAAFFDKDSISLDDLLLDNNLKSSIKENVKDAVFEFEKKYIIDALEKAEGNQTKAAQILGIHRTTLVEKMKLFGIK